MAFQEIKYKDKPLTIHKAISSPRFNDKNILVTDTWAYIDLWLRRRKKEQARFFWNQAKNFYDATLALPKTSAPLTAYYCFLNATKALLLAKNIKFSDQHGVSGYSIGNHVSLSNEKIKFKDNGVLGALCSFLQERNHGQIYTLLDVLYNLSYIHRAFNLTFNSYPELFIPIRSPKIVRSITTHEAWFCAELEDKYASKRTLNKLPSSFERELSVRDKYIIRYKKRFRWVPKDRRSLQRYKNYHKRIRKHVFYINGPKTLWYLKRSGNITQLIDKSTISLTFAAMHRLSESSRYSPDLLARHFDNRQNWLLSEFISIAPAQFIDKISSEMTGHQFMMPGYKSYKD